MARKRLGLPGRRGKILPFPKEAERATMEKIAGARERGAQAFHRAPKEMPPGFMENYAKTGKKLQEALKGTSPANAELYRALSVALLTLSRAAASHTIIIERGDTRIHDALALVESKKGFLMKLGLTGKDIGYLTEIKKHAK